MNTYLETGYDNAYFKSNLETAYQRNFMAFQHLSSEYLLFADYLKILKEISSHEDFLNL